MESCVNSDLGEYPDFGALADDWNPAKLAVINADELNATLETPVKQTDETLVDETLVAPATKKDQPSPSKVVTGPLSSPSTSNANISYFDPNAMSTPAKGIQTPEQQQPQQQQSQSFDSFNSTLLAPSSQLSTQSVNYSGTQFTYQYPTTSTYSIGSFEPNSPILIPVMTFTSNSNSVNQYSTQLSSNLIKMPSEATTTTSAIPSTVITSFQADENSAETERLNRQIRSKSAQGKPGHRAKRSRFKSAAYRELEHLDLNTVQPKVNIIQICKEISIKF